MIRFSPLVCLIAVSVILNTGCGSSVAQRQPKVHGLPAFVRLINLSNSDVKFEDHGRTLAFSVPPFSASLFTTVPSEPRSLTVTLANLNHKLSTSVSVGPGNADSLILAGSNLLDVRNDITKPVSGANVKSIELKRNKLSLSFSPFKIGKTTVSSSDPIQVLDGSYTIDQLPVDISSTQTYLIVRDLSRNKTYCFSRPINRKPSMGGAGKSA